MTTTTQPATEKPTIMPGHLEKQFANNPDKLHKRRAEYPLNMCKWLAEDMARRIAESKKLFNWTFFRGDCHSHTHHSDGGGTVAETAEMAKAAALDFQWVTDHWGITQGPECREHNLWCGQEPVTKHHHMGILNLDYAFEPQMDFLADIAAVKAAGGTPFVPHPTGWWPVTIYEKISSDLLEQLPDPYLMEICNGANNIVNAFDYTDASALQQWDHLLCLGKIVHALGNTDAHMPHGIGMVWNSVFAKSCDQPNILKELSLGHSFVSDGPLLHIQLGQAQMGDRATPEDRTQKLAITAVDSRGLSTLKIIADGKPIAAFWAKGKTKFTKRLPIPATAAKYLRVETHSLDARRAYSNPIYLP
jgi:hypothetical protein